jgi:carbonic anhydrase
MGKLDYNELLNNNKKWISEKLSLDADYFKKLSTGQSPKYLMIGCSDSRVPLNSMLQAGPGEIFIHRNIANQVSLRDINFLSVLEYSVMTLRIKHIIVTGHYRCGGVAAAVDGVDHGLIENWTAPIHDLYISNKDELEALNDKQDRLDRLSEINVTEQAKNIFKTPVMARAFERGDYPTVHSWIFDIYTGQIKEILLPIEKWKQEGYVPEFYRKR